MEKENKIEFNFPIGYKEFHKNQLYNFQLNRWYSLGYIRQEDLNEVGQSIKTFDDWKREMIKQAEISLTEGRLLNSAFYYRAAEFYTKSKDADKVILYDKFIELFYKSIESDKIEKFKIPYENAFLYALRIQPASIKKGTIVIHGGFDSFIEEWYSVMKFFSKNGYEVIGFEGPGQGATLRKYGIPLTYEWEKPTKAVLYYFNLTDITLIGFSMGGWFALRASAFDQRIKRVIANGHAIDYMKSMNFIFRKIHLWCFEHCRNFMDKMADKKFQKENIASWAVEHLRYITKKNKSMDALEIYLLMNEKNIHSENVKQDVLILTSKNDHMIPIKMHKIQLKALKKASSVTGRVFTKSENAQNHCQSGNIGLALEVMLNWINEKSNLN